MRMHGYPRVGIRQTVVCIQGGESRLGIGFPKNRDGILLPRGFFEQLIKMCFRFFFSKKGIEIPQSGPWKIRGGSVTGKD